MAEATVTVVDTGIVQLTIDFAQHPGARDPLRLAVGTALAPSGRIESGAVTTIWQGPRDWLLLCARDAANDLARHCTAAAGPVPALANDVSAGMVVLDLGGGDAADLLAGGTGIDLDATSFPPGATAVTRFADVRATIVHAPDAPGRYRMIVDRSRALHVQRWLAAAARDRQDQR